MISQYTLRCSRPRRDDSSETVAEVEEREPVVPRLVHTPIRFGVVRAKTETVLAAWYLASRSGSGISFGV